MIHLIALYEQITGKLRDGGGPRLWFYENHGTWTVAPGEALGLPSDVQTRWRTPEEAVDVILAFIFGDPQRMQAKAADEEARRRSKTYPDFRFSKNSLLIWS